MQQILALVLWAMNDFKKKYNDYAALRCVPFSTLISRLSEENERRLQALSGGAKNRPTAEIQKEVRYET